MKQVIFEGHLYCLMGKSCTGKDSLYKALLEDESLSLKSLVTYTTRPMRTNEVDGVDYKFVTVEQLREFEANGHLIEERVYQTVNGPWHYATVADEQLQAGAGNFLSIVTLEAFLKLRLYFGAHNVIPLYITVDDHELLSRAIRRESKECKPNYKEVCRRFLADAEDFSQEELSRAGISRIFYNEELKGCVEELRQVILQKELL